MSLDFLYFLSALRLGYRGETGFQGQMAEDNLPFCHKVNPQRVLKKTFLLENRWLRIFLLLTKEKQLLLSDFQNRERAFPFKLNHLEKMLNEDGLFALFY